MELERERIYRKSIQREGLKNMLKIDEDGDRRWYNENDELSREDGPAIEYRGESVAVSNGTKEWYLNGKRHRKDGPAIEWSDGAKEWYLDGKRHRADGPAVEDGNGYKEYWLNNNEYTKEKYKKKVKKYVRNR